MLPTIGRDVGPGGRARPRVRDLQLTTERRYTRATSATASPAAVNERWVGDSIGESESDTFLRMTLCTHQSARLEW